MAKWKEKKMVETPKGWKEHLAYDMETERMKKAIQDIIQDRQDELHGDPRPTQIGIDWGKVGRPAPLKTEDDPADDNPCPTCKGGVCQCGPDEEDWLEDVEEDEEWVKVTVQPAYYDLFIVLQKALYQAQDGKGAERHGNGLSFTEQPALTITRAVGLGFPLGQAMKKIQESQRMDTDAAKRELLGAINYLAAAVLFLDENAD